MADDGFNKAAAIERPSSRAEEYAADPRHLRGIRLAKTRSS